MKNPIEYAWQKAAAKLGFNKLPLAHFLVLRGVFYGGFGSAWNFLKYLETQPEEKRKELTAMMEKEIEKETGKAQAPEKKIII